MSVAPPTTNTPNTYYWLAAFVTVLLALVAGCGLFIVVERVPNLATPTPLEVSGSLDNDTNNDGSVDGIVAPLVAGAPARPVRGMLDNDLDNNGNPDGVASSSVGLASVLLGISLLGGGLLLWPCVLWKRSSVHCPALERPG